MKSFIRFISGVLIGAFVGSLIAILLAPSSGDDLRVRIYANANKLGDEVRKAALDKRAELEKELSDLRGNIMIS